jgi:hypothetical protein
MEDKNSEILRLMNLPLEDVYWEIGTHLEGGLRASPRPRHGVILDAKEWVAGITKQVCQSGKLKTLARQDLPTQEMALAICGVLDLILHALGSVPVTSVAVIIVRVGLHKFCAAIWDSASQATEEEPK